MQGFPFYFHCSTLLTVQLLRDGEAVDAAVSLSG